MVSPKVQAMWIESQHYSKSIVKVPLASQQAEKILEDLKTSCSSPNKAVQVEALKCWGLWMYNQNPDVWKVNTVCFTAIRPLITKKLQPLHKDVDICKLKLSLMWALLVKVQDLMQLEGPQYILEVFLQFCLTWLSSTSGNDNENDIFLLIFQLLLAVFNKNETLTGCDKEEFPPLSSNILHIKKVFHQLAEKFLNVFVYWRKVEDKSVILKIWRHFLGYCEQSYEHIPIPVWHKIFKLAGQICSEKDEPVKERLAFLHSCATTLKSALSSSKFIDFGNLLTTPCEVLLKKLVELCTTECNESRDSEMFLHSKEICQVLSDKSVAINGYDLCISVLDTLEEFCLRSLFWGVWCGLVYCYKVLLMGNHRSEYTKTERKFYRKLRGVAVNFELDRKDLDEDCAKEVERHIGFLNINCLCSFGSVEALKNRSEETAESEELKEKVLAVPRCDFNGVSNKIVPVMPRCALGRFSFVSLQKKKTVAPKKTLHVNFDLIKNVFGTLTLSRNSRKSLFSSMFGFRFAGTETGHQMEVIPRTLSLSRDVGIGIKRDLSLVVCRREEKAPPPKRPSTPMKKNVVKVDLKPEIEEDIISTPTTRSKRRAEEEKRKRELEMHKRRKRKSFEVLVQEIVRKNKERKTEKNNKKRKSSDGLNVKCGRRNVETQSNKDKQEKGKKSPECSDRRLRNSKKQEQAKNKKNPSKNEGKLENYFKVIAKKTGDEAKKQPKKPSKTKQSKKKTSQSTCCKSDKEEGKRRGEIGWRQTSLKTLMNPKSKVEKVRQGLRTREKTADVAEKPKTKNDGRKELDRPLAQLSPFKEVFHDHEYAKMTLPEKIKTPQKLAVIKEKMKSAKGRPGKDAGKTHVKKTSKPQLLVTVKVNRLETNAVAEKKTSKAESPQDGRDESAHVEAPVQISKTSESEEMELQEIFTPEEPDFKKMEINEATACSKIDTESLIKESVEEEFKKPGLEIVEESRHVPANRIDDRFDINREELPEIETSSDKRCKKRPRTPEIVKPRKKMKLEEEEATEDLSEEKLPLEVTEKENLEEKRQPELASPVKKEKSCWNRKQNDSPKEVSGGMSRALRIIGLVPESTKGRSWESSPRMEALKCVKAPNVDRNSRASKMLALLSENIVEPEEMILAEEVDSLAMTTTPNAKTPSSSLKSPKSIKKRRSIRFDDARNETVLYLTDTPPSQILEEKEKCRGMRPFEMALHLP